MIFGKIKLYLAAFAVGAMSLLGLYLKIGHDAKKRIKGDAAIKDAEAIDKGRKAVLDGRNSGDTPDERVRKNDGRWM